MCSYRLLNNDVIVLVPLGRHPNKDATTVCCGLGLQAPPGRFQFKDNKRME